MNKSVLILFLGCILLACAQPYQEIPFGALQSLTCTMGTSGMYETTFSVAAQAQTGIPHFVLHFINSPDIQAYAGLTTNVNATNAEWSYNQDDSMPYNTEELWITSQTAGTVVYVYVYCGLSSQFSVFPAVPQTLDTSTETGFMQTIINSAVPNWMAIPVTQNTFLARVEPCMSLPNSIFYARVVFPGVANNGASSCGSNPPDFASVPDNICGYASSGYSLTISGSALLQGNPSSTMMYVFAGAFSTSSDIVPSQYSVSTVLQSESGSYLAYALPSDMVVVDINNDMYIIGQGSSTYMPTDVDSMSLYFTDSAPDAFFSACFLKLNGQKYKYTGRLDNTTTNSKLILSDVDLLYAGSFFKTNPIDYSKTRQYVVTVNDNHAALPVIYAQTKIGGNPLGDAQAWFIAFIVTLVAAVIFATVMIVAIYKWKQSSANYKPIL